MKLEKDIIGLNSGSLYNIKISLNIFYQTSDDCVNYINIMSLLGLFLG